MSAPVATSLEAAVPDEVVLSAHDVTKVFRGRSRSGGGGVRAVDGVSLEVRSGEIMALVGESGCGKSTLARCLVGLLEPSSGDIRSRGQSVRDLRGRDLRAFRRRVQIVFQDPSGSLNPRVRVGRALEEVLQVHRLAGARTSRRRRIVDLLERVGLDPAEADRLPHELSGGQRQRVSIARSLAVEPEVLVLDEPVSALDVSIRAQIVNLLQDLREAHGLTYLFIAHDLALVEHLSDRVAVMQQGRIVEQGPTDAVFQAPEHHHTRALLEAVPHVLPGAREGASGGGTASAGGGASAI